jgi:hypothetical protein
MNPSSSTNLTPGRTALPVRHDQRPARRQHALPRHRKLLPSDGEHDALRRVLAVRGERGDEVPRDEVVQPPRVAAADPALRRGFHRRDGRVVTRVIPAPMQRCRLNLKANFEKPGNHVSGSRGRNQALSSYGMYCVPPRWLDSTCTGPTPRPLH